VETTGTLKPALWILSLLGDPPRELIADGASAAVSPDGQRIAFLRGVPSSALVSVSVVPWGFGREIWTMRPDGTEQDLLVPAKDDWVGSITWSPASTQIAYLRIDIGQPNSVRVVTLREHQTREVLSSTALREAIHWSEDGRLFYVLAEDSPNFRDANVWAASLRGAGEISGRSERLTRGHGGIISISGSLDGTVLTFVRSIRDFNIHLDSLLPDGRSTKEKRLALDDSSAVPFSWMADSKSLVFVSRRNGTWDIFKQEIDKPLAEGIVVTSDRWEWIPRLVSYSGEILYTSVADPSPKAPVSLFAVPASGGVSRFILTDEHIDNHQCALPTSPVCVYSKTTAKKESFYKFNLKTGETSDLLVIHSGMVNWGLSPDGRTLAIIDITQPETVIQLWSVSSGEKRELSVAGWPKLETVDWAADGKSMFVATGVSGGKSSLLNVYLDGRVKVLRNENNQLVHWAVPSPDGHRLAIMESSFYSNVWVTGTDK